MATATKKRTASKKASSKKAASKKSAAKKAATKKAAAKKSSAKNKLGVKNSLVDNINAHKKRGDSKSKKKSTVDKKQYNKMEQHWEKGK